MHFISFCQALWLNSLLFLQLWILVASRSSMKQQQLTHPCLAIFCFVIRQMQSTVRGKWSVVRGTWYVYWLVLIQGEELQNWPDIITSTRNTWWLYILVLYDINWCINFKFHFNRFWGGWAILIGKLVRSESWTLNLKSCACFHIESLGGDFSTITVTVTVTVTITISVSHAPCSFSLLLPHKF